MPNLIDEVKVLGAKRLGPCIADALMVQRDGLGKLLFRSLGGISLALCASRHPPSESSQNFVAFFSGRLTVTCIWMGSASSPVQKVEKIATKGENLRHYAVSLSSYGASESSKMRGALSRRNSFEVGKLVIRKAVYVRPAVCGMRHRAVSNPPSRGRSTAILMVPSSWRFEYAMHVPSGNSA